MKISTIEDLGRRIRAKRDEADLTADDVAALARVSRRLLLEVEQGKRANVGFANVLRVIEVLGLRLEVTARGLPGIGSRGE
ncbi:MAG TPA: helix-turn-helix domain-containing protein [Gemmatimonadales bacterium]